MIRLTAVGLAVLMCGGSAPAADPRTDAFGDPLPNGAIARLGTNRMWFTARDPVTPLPPDYKTFLAVVPGGVRRHDLATGRPVPGSDLPVDRLLAVSGDGKRVAGLRKRTLGVYPVAGGEPVWVAELAGRWPTAALSADGRLLAVAEVGKGDDARVSVVVRDLGKDEVVAGINPGLSHGAELDLSPDGRLLAIRRGSSGPTGGGPVPLRVWDVRTGKERFAVAEWGSVVRFSPDGSTLAVAAAGGWLDLWDTGTGTRSRRIRPRGQETEWAFSPDGKVLAAVGRGLAVERWAVADGRTLGAADPPAVFDNPAPRGVGFAADGRLVAWCLNWGTTLVWDAGAGKKLSPLGEHTNRVVSVGFAAGGREAVTSARDGRLVRWDAATGKPLGPAKLRLAPGAAVTELGAPLLLSADATRALSYEFRTGLYDLTTGGEVYAVPTSEPAAPPDIFPPKRIPVPSADFTRLAFLHVTTGEVGDVTCDLWDLPARRKLRTLAFPGISGQVVAAFNRGGTRLVVATALPDRTGMDGLSVSGWDLTTGRKVGEVRYKGQAVRVAAVGEAAAVLTSLEKVWAVDLAAGTTGEDIDTFPPEPIGFSHVNGPPPVVVGPGEAWFAYGSPAGRPGEYGVTVRDWPRGRVVKTFAGHAGPVTCLTVSPDGKTLASGSEDTTVLLWDVSDLGPKK